MLCCGRSDATLAVLLTRSVGVRENERCDAATEGVAVVSVRSKGREVVQVQELRTHGDGPRHGRSWLPVWISSLVAACAAAATGYATELRYSLPAWIIAGSLVLISAFVTAFEMIGPPRR